MSRPPTLPGAAKWTALAVAGGVGLAAVSRLLAAKRTRERGVALITGGSRGLGLALAERCVQLGYSVAICARDGDELERAEELLQRQDAAARVGSFVCDVTEPAQVAHLIHNVIERFGRLDLLINNAGLITVGPFENASIELFELSLKTMFWAPLHAIRAALPHLRVSKGTIVNITSIGGKVSIPHLLPYSCAKFAAVALSEGLHVELAKEGVKVVTIVPGLMRTGSHLRAQFHGEKRGEYAWFGLGATLPLLSMNARRAAKQIVSAAERGAATKVLSVPAVLLDKAHALAPALTQRILSLVDKYVLPSAIANGGLREGREIAPELSGLYRALTELGDKAADRFNQR